MQLKATLPIFMLLYSLVAYGQQPAQYSLYMMNQLNWNPGYAGLEHSLSVTGGFRQQWVGLEGSPSTQFISAHLPLYVASGGVGLHLENDELGAIKMTTSILSYNYQIFSEAGILSFGISGGLIQYTLDGSLLRTPDGSYSEPGFINHEDDLLPLSAVSTSANTFGAGIYFQSEKIEAGLGVRHLNEPIINLESLSIPLKRAFFLNLGAHFEISSRFSLHPSMLVKSDLTQTQTDISLIARYNDNIFGGVAFRGYNTNSIDAASFIVGFKLSENLNLYYAYDLTLSDLNTVSNGSHEIMVNYNLNKRLGAGRPPRIIYNPRSL